MKKKQKKALVRILISALLLVLLIILYKIIGPKETDAGDIIPGLINEPVWFILYMIPYFIIGYDILLKAVKGIFRGRVFDENFLMAVATVGAIVLALIKKNGDYTEGIAVMLFYQIGEFFQSYAVGKSRKNISALMDIRPDYANIEKDGQLVRVVPDEVEVGSIIVVQPGEKVPIDGTVIEGTSSLNTSALTGESLPRDVSEGDAIISGCINLTGVIKVKTDKEFGESTVSKILELVENSSSNKSRSEAFISKFAKIYTPAVCISALLLALLPPIVNMLILKSDAQWGVWIYRALTFLVISCPCALVISIPLSFFAGLGGASKAGVLIKGSNYLENLSYTNYVVFDKTGTLTKGVFNVNDIHHNTIPEESLIELAALAECASSHPISVSLKTAYGKDIDRARVTDLTEISGHGIKAVVDGKEILAGNDKLMKKEGIDYKPCHMSGTIVHIAINGEYAGHIVISDELKDDSVEAIKKLKDSGIGNLVMLTGDSDLVAKEVATTLGITEYHSSLLPADKVEKVENLIKNKNAKQTLAFVGDGINDAPVLARADIGIAMGSMGSDAAIEAADVVIMDDNPLRIVKAIKISKKCLRIVYENIVFALGIKFACLILGALGITNMWIAIFADVGVMIIAVLNAIRALNTKNI
ncbi:MAG: cadmium-translocating P-type ATPase [Lachnospiraceae bacterium]|nr:cadmium-translocating P-type ATPase [Lachnospiraceae bacterium]